MIHPPPPIPKNKGGRPPKAGPLLTQAERNNRYKAKLERAGGRTVRAALRGDEASALDAIMERQGITVERDAIAWAIMRAARRVPKKPL